MRKLLSCFGALVLVLAGPTLAREQKRGSETISADDKSVLQSALDLGLELFKFDQAAWHATDALLDDMDDSLTREIGGWVVTPVDAGHRVTFWKPSGDHFSGVFSAIYDGNKITEREILKAENAALDPEQIALIRAQQLTDPNDLERCSNKPFNIVVMPSGKDNDSIYVYYLTPQTSTSSIPIGGHYRFEVANGKVIDQRSFTNSCFEMPLQSDKRKGKPKVFFFTHLLDNVPTEIHVFSVFAAKAPMVVMTVKNERMWAIDVSSGQPRARLVKQ